jgi:CTP:molybdopterin cytidylyltransferase MocA
MNIAVLILAAGMSSRMGQQKALLTIGGETIIERLVSVFHQNDVKVFIVTGYHGQYIVQALKNQEVTVVENPNYELGMFTSVQAGVRALQPAIEAFFVMPVDIPLVKSETIKSLINEHNQNPGKIIYPVFGGTRGHPPLIPGNLVTVIVNWSKDGNLRDVLISYSNPALEVEVNDKGILIDIDTLEDYESLLKSLD